MELLLPLAAKSLLIAGAVLLVLRLARRRSAAERSWIAHIGLAAIAALPLALLLPRIEVPAPAFLPEPTAAIAMPASHAAKEVALPASSFPAAQVAAPAAGVDWVSWLYAAPAALLLLLTLTALLRLVLLKAKANVLVEPRWLSALAHAQRRMGFKHGTALLTSDELRSPISWGLMRPVILLNSEAADAHAQAEAVIAHELAHVAHLDWLKLLLARVTVAIFWFNPLVWVLAREAHQLREEAADDAVLAADIVDTDYAQLLVGVARHECRGLLIGAHGVAPCRNSLARRVRRVLDSGSVRRPVGWGFALGMFAGASMVAAPLAALTLTPGGFKSPEREAPLLASVAPSSISPAQTSQSARVTERASDPASAAVAAVAGAAHPHWTDEEVRRLNAELEQARRQDWNGRDPLPGIVGPLPDMVGPRPGTVGPRPGTVGPGAPTVGPVDAAPGDFESVSVTGGGDVLVRYGRTHQVRILRGHGPGAFVNASNGALSVSCQRGCRDLLVEVTTPHVEALAVNGGGSIQVAGGFPLVADLALAIRGGGRIDARQLRARTVAAATQGGGTILTSARDQIAASTVGGGNIRYWGEATVASAIKGGGRIEPGGT